MNTNNTIIINSNVLSVVKWCDSQNLKYIHFKLNRDQDNKKQPAFLTKYFKKGVHDFTDEEIDEHNRRLEEDGILDNHGNCNAVSIRLKGSGWVMIDTDDIESENYISNLNLECPTTTTNGGKHRFIKLDNMSDSLQRIIKLNGLNLDIITDFVWETKTRKVNNPNKILTMNILEFNKLLGITEYYKTLSKQVDTQVEKFKENEPIYSSNVVDIKKIDKEILWKILDNLNPNYFKNLNEWKNFLPAIYNQIPIPELTQEYREKAFTFLRGMTDYNDTYELENYKYWDKIVSGKYIQGAGVIWNWIKTDNPEYFKELSKTIKNRLDIHYYMKLENYKEKKEYVEQFINRVNSDGKIVYIEKKQNGEISIYTQENLRQRLQTFHVWVTKKIMGVEVPDKIKFTDLWLADEYIKTYEELVFYPPPKICDTDYYNLYDGLRAEKELKDIKPT